MINNYDIDDDLVLENETVPNDYDLKVNETMSDCYEAIAWFDNNTRFQIIAELIHRFKTDEDKQMPSHKK